MSRRRNLLVGWTLAIATMVGFVNLGLWQSRRAVEKQGMLDAAQAVLTARRPLPLSLAADPARARDYDWTQGQGEFVDAPAVLLDNQQREGRTGVRVYRLFAEDGGMMLLADLGWLPLPGDRRMPAVPRPEGRVAVRGLLVRPPSAGLVGADVEKTDDGDNLLVTRLDAQALPSALGLQALPPRVLRLDPQLEIGYQRDLELLPNTLPPEKHRGYAVQWFALALAVLVTALVLTFRRTSTNR